MKRILISPDREVEIECNPDALARSPLESGTTIVLHENQVHRITRAPGRLLVNGKEVHLALADPRDRRRNSTGNTDGGRRSVKAAMPGKVIKILVTNGESIAASAGLLILEAMKMQNEVRSPGAGAVAAVHVKVGDTVAAGQVLVTLE